MIENLSEALEPELVRAISNYKDDIANVFNLLYTAITDDTCGLLDIESAEKQCSSIFRAIKLYKRFNALNKLANDSLSVYSDRFEFGGYKFETLDKVEAALKLKAFL